MTAYYLHVVQLVALAGVSDIYIYIIIYIYIYIQLFMSTRYSPFVAM